MKELTKQEKYLIEFADNCEASNFKPSHYYRLMSAIIAARSVKAQIEREKDKK